MLRVRIEIIPYGVETLAREIGRIDIANVSEKTEFGTMNTYQVNATRTPHREPEQTRKVTVEFLRGLPATALAYKAIKELGWHK